MVFVPGECRNKQRAVSDAECSVKHSTQCEAQAETATILLADLAIIPLVLCTSVCVCEQILEALLFQSYEPNMQMVTVCSEMRSNMPTYRPQGHRALTQSQQEIHFATDTVCTIHTVNHVPIAPLARVLSGSTLKSGLRAPPLPHTRRAAPTAEHRCRRLALEEFERDE